MLLAIRESREFIVAPQFVQEGPENSYMTQSLTAFNAVLIGQGKKVVAVGRLVGEDGSLISCETNFGDPKTSKELSAKECSDMLASYSGQFSSVTVFISLPDPKLGRPRVILSRNTVSINPSSFESVSYVSYVFLSSLYDDAQSMIGNANAIVSRI